MSGALDRDRPGWTQPGRGSPVRARVLSEAWEDRLLALRDRAVASAAFRRWAAGFPLTRPIARRRARALFDLCGGFVYAQVLRACVELDVFARLAEGPARVEALAPRFGLSVDATGRLCAAAAGLKLLSRRRDGRYGLGALGAAMVGNAAIAAMVRHHALLYGDLADPVALLRRPRGEAALAAYWQYSAAAEAHEVTPYSALMAASQALVAGEVLGAYPVARHRHLMDVGGGDGSFLRAVHDVAPGLRLTLFDLPAVAAAFRTRLAGLATVVGGDAIRGALPADADLISLVRVIHDHDDAAALAILRAARAALTPGGTLLLAEPMAETPGAESVGAYFGFYLLAMGRGEPRSAARLTVMLREAGFGAVRERRTRTPLLVRVLAASVSLD